MSTLQTTNLKNPSSGSNNIVLGADGSTTIPTLSATTITGTTVRGGVISGTAVASTSGVSIDFTGIPSWAKRITVMFNGVSTNGTSGYLVQIGAGSIDNTGYSGVCWSAAANYANSSIGIRICDTPGAGNTYQGSVVIKNISGSIWVADGVLLGNINTANSVGNLFAFTKTLSGTLDRVRITTVNGTDAFDAGSINILYEG